MLGFGFLGGVERRAQEGALHVEAEAVLLEALEAQEVLRAGPKRSCARQGSLGVEDFRSVPGHPRAGAAHHGRRARELGLVPFGLDSEQGDARLDDISGLDEEAVDGAGQVGVDGDAAVGVDSAGGRDRGDDVPGRDLVDSDRDTLVGAEDFCDRRREEERGGRERDGELAPPTQGACSRSAT